MAGFSDRPTAAKDETSVSARREDAANSDRTDNGEQIQAEAAVSGSFESAVEHLCRPRMIVETGLTVQPNEDMARFDEYWESLVPGAPVVPRIEPLAKRVSLVPVTENFIPIEPKAEDASEHKADDAWSTWLSRTLAEG